MHNLPLFSDTSVLAMSLRIYRGASVIQTLPYGIDAVAVTSYSIYVGQRTIAPEQTDETE
jgi:hypothetical protein